MYVYVPTRQAGNNIAVAEVEIVSLQVIGPKFHVNGEVEEGGVYHVNGSQAFATAKDAIEDEQNKIKDEIEFLRREIDHLSPYL